MSLKKIKLTGCLGVILMYSFSTSLIAQEKDQDEFKCLRASLSQDSKTIYQCFLKKQEVDLKKIALKQEEKKKFLEQQKLKQSEDQKKKEIAEKKKKKKRKNYINTHKKRNISNQGKKYKVYYGRILEPRE